MPSSVYSTRFMSHPLRSAAEATAARYVIPVGKVAVVRSIDFLVFATGLNFVGRLSGGFFVGFFSAAGIPAFESRHWDGDQVFIAGEIISPQWNGGDMHVTVSGFLLNAP